MALAANRFGADGLYLLDEPEAALSITLLAIVTRAANSGAQFVIATHSPVLLAAPAAQIYELDEEGISSAVYDDLQAVRQMRGFLNAPDRYLRQIMIDSEARVCRPLAVVLLHDAHHRAGDLSAHPSPWLRNHPRAAFRDR